jgi:hypothetical protein
MESVFGLTNNVVKKGSIYACAWRSLSSVALQSDFSASGSSCGTPLLSFMTDARLLRLLSCLFG